VIDATAASCAGPLPERSQTDSLMTRGTQRNEDRFGIVA
jgi:hypothetical protein